MIELQNVTKIYDDSVKAVDEVSFTINEGETFGLIGTSGCGKTTTLKMINRLIEPTSGSILLNGSSVAGRPPEKLRRDIGYVIQSVGLFPHYTIEENVAIVPRLLDWKKERVSQRADELLELVGLNPGEFSQRKPEALSGGQQQRVGLARALAADPPVILMDEPFGALDPITKEHVRNEFRELLRKMNKTVVLVTHDVFEAFDLCGRICLMDQGRVQQIGTPKELLFNPQNEFVRSFFDTHRFQLEMMSVTIEDIMKEMDPGTGNIQSPTSQRGTEFGPGRIQGDVNAVEMKASFFSVFESSGSKRETYIVSDTGGEKTASIQIHTDALLKGFQQVRTRLRERKESHD